MSRLQALLQGLHHIEASRYAQSTCRVDVPGAWLTGKVDSGIHLHHNLRPLYVRFLVAAIVSDPQPSTYV